MDSDILHIWGLHKNESKQTERAEPCKGEPV